MNARSVIRGFRLELLEGGCKMKGGSAGNLEIEWEKLVKRNVGLLDFTICIW